MRLRETQLSCSARLEGWGGPHGSRRRARGCRMWVGLRSRLLTMRPGGAASDRNPLERRRPASLLVWVVLPPFQKFLVELLVALFGL